MPTRTILGSAFGTLVFAALLGCPDGTQVPDDSSLAGPIAGTEAESNEPPGTAPEFPDDGDQGEHTAVPADTDGDGLTDDAERSLGTDPMLSDSDGDGLDDPYELDAGTDPLSSDSDGDGLTDGEEIDLGTNPLNDDTDYDALTDAEELLHSTNPLNSDTDGDGLLDGLELDPLLGMNPPEGVPADTWPWVGTDPLNPDTDGDTLLDGFEVDMGLNPLVPNVPTTVAEVLCDDIILLSNGGVWQSNDSHGFSSWQGGELIAVDIGGVANLDRLQSRRAEYLGDEQGRSSIWEIASDQSWIELFDGTIWIVDVFDEFEIWNWLLGDRVIVVSETVAVPEYGVVTVWMLVNVNECETAGVRPGP